MFASIRQTWAVIQINLLSINERLSLVVSGCIAIGLVVFVLLGSLALGNGFENTMQSAGAEDTAIVMREGADGEINSQIERAAQVELEGAPGVRSEGGEALVSPEMYVVVDAIKKSTGLKANVALRGVTPAAWQVRRAMHVVEGRMARPGTNEIVMGEAVAREFAGYAVGNTINLRGATWTVVGTFAANGSVFESELWGDLHVVQPLMGMGDAVQSVRLGLTGSADVPRVQAWLKGKPELHLSAQSERQFYADQAQHSSDLIAFLGKPLAVIMALGALAGALNTMYGGVAERGREMATLRAIGFGRWPAFAGTIVESLLLAVAGAALGILLAYLVFNHMSASTLGASFSTVVFRLSLSGDQLLQGARWALMIGFIGGLFPAISTIRAPLVKSLTE